MKPSPSFIATACLVAGLAVFVSIVGPNKHRKSSFLLDILIRYIRTGKSAFPWHNTTEWASYLSLYDEMAINQFGAISECSSTVVTTSYGPTQIHACGDSKADPVILFHGATYNSLQYREWLVPAIVSAGRYTIAVDFICDCGRSSPLDGDISNCPKDKEALADWVQQLMDGLGIDKPASLVGYSYGSFIASSVALYKPDLVEKIALIAPAAVVAPLTTSFLLRGVVYSLVKTSATRDWFYRFMASADPKFELSSKPELLAATKVGATVLTVNPEPFEDEVLKRMAKKHPMKLFIGAEETIISVSLAVERAKRAGMETKIYPQTDHLMSTESAAWDQIKLDVTSFLVD